MAGIIYTCFTRQRAYMMSTKWQSFVEGLAFTIRAWGKLYTHAVPRQRLLMISRELQCFVEGLVFTNGAWHIIHAGEGIGTCLASCKSLWCSVSEFSFFWHEVHITEIWNQNSKPVYLSTFLTDKHGLNCASAERQRDASVLHRMPWKDVRHDKNIWIYEVLKRLFWNPSKVFSV
jgi:hypothetical protein